MPYRRSRIASGLTPKRPRVKVHPDTGLRAFDSAQDLRSFAAENSPPTADDCTVLIDGTRIDTAEKGPVFLASVAARLKKLNESAPRTARDVS